MRSNVDPQKIEQLMKILGREARGAGSIYFTGGASALLIGWRNSTVDIDIRLDPELALYAKLQHEQDDAYAYYNALLHSLNSFCTALELATKDVS
jgi:hypothetical protein